MPTRPSDPPIVELAISVSEMARRLTLSRARFYELIAEGVFPHPCYCLYTRRALYPAELQQQCLSIRATNLGANGRYTIFYRPRAIAPSVIPPTSRNRRVLARPAAIPINPQILQIREGLASLGMANLPDDRIETALRSAFPTGTDGIDPGTVLASVFRLLRNPQIVRSTSAS